MLDPLDAPLLESYLAEGSLDLSWAPEPELGMLVLNNAPVGRQGEAYFQAPAARQAVAACLNRQQLVIDLFGIYGSLPGTWPLGALADANPGTGSLAYDPQAGRDLLRSIGWVENETEPGQPRVAWGVPGVAVEANWLSPTSRLEAPWRKPSLPGSSRTSGSAASGFNFRACPLKRG